ncbi:MAG: transglycosylase SLT domain-containing protein [Firmicutes bacterium]|nr:transglycosylase SLT domain-containing protein [Bacillota bacterium]
MWRDNMNEDAFDVEISRAAKEYSLPPALIKAAIKQESAFNPRAYRDEPAISDGSYGLMQLLYQTARSLGYTGTPAGLFDPGTNILLGAKYIRSMMDQFHQDERLAIAGYNAGPGLVARLLERYGTSFEAVSTHLPSVTRHHVESVMAYYEEFLEGPGLRRQ